jgi:hypothetical protein
MLSLWRLVHDLRSISSFGLEFQTGESISNPSVVRILVVDDFADWRRCVLGRNADNLKAAVALELLAIR